VIVYITSKGGKVQIVFNSHITSKKEYNSWFYVDFKKKVFVPKEAECTVSVKSSNVYQLIPFAHIKENIDTVVKCAEISELNFNLFERENKGDKKYTEKSLEKDADYLFCIKSLTVVPVDEQGCFHME